MKITSVSAMEILDSRGNPTVLAKVTAGSANGVAATPSGASTGSFEAAELRDGGKRYLGKGVQNAVANVNTTIAKAIVGMEVENQEEIDKKMIELDGTENKSRLGGNAIVAVSMAVLRCAANSKGKELYEHLNGKLLPTPMLNILNGGKHAGGKLAIQEFMIMPKGAKNFSEMLQFSVETYHVLGKRLVKKYGVSAKNVGDEGGFAPQMNSGDEALDEIVGAIEEAGYSREIKIAMDAAASSFYDEKTKKYLIDGKNINANALCDYYVNLTKSYPIISIEDPFFEDEFDAFAELTAKIGSKIQIVGDDLVVTNPKRIATAIQKKSMNALLLKVNQIGTVTEAKQAAKMCKDKKMGVVVSHRSGETEDSFIADFAVGIDAGQIKTGAPCRSERNAKYNRLLQIERNLKGNKW